MFAGAVVVALAFPVSGSVDYGGYRPHYQGYGVDTRGGRGGSILRVTNLNDSGSGSLRAALEFTGPRFVIFETSGTIALNAPIFVSSPYVTIAGQTAPSPGINVRNWPIYFDTHDVVVQHIRLRMGDTAQPGPGQFVAIGAGLNNAHHIVFDHVSVAWTMYQAFFFCNYTGSGPNPTNTTILDSIFAFGLVTTSPSNTGMGGLYCGASNGTPTQHTEARNLYVHNAHRQPQLSPGTRLSIVNNVVYGSGPSAQAEDYAFLMAWMNTCGNPRMDSNPTSRIEAAVVNTVTIPSLGTGKGSTAGSDEENRSFFMVLNSNNLTFQQNRFWFRGNQGPFITGPTGAGQWAGVLYSILCGGIPGSEAALEYESEPSLACELRLPDDSDRRRSGSRLRECRSAATRSRCRRCRGGRPGASGVGGRYPEHGLAAEKSGRHGRTPDIGTERPPARDAARTRTPSPRARCSARPWRCGWRRLRKLSSRRWPVQQTRGFSPPSRR